MSAGSMKLVNEKHRTRHVGFEVEGIRHRVEFDGAGRAEVDANLGKLLVDRFDSIREAKGPDDVAAGYLEEQPWYGVDATEAAKALAEQAGIGPEDVEATGAGGRIIEKDVEKALADRGGPDA